MPWPDGIPPPTNINLGYESFEAKPHLHTEPCVLGV